MNSVLIIDDDKELCALMKKCVEQENLSAVVAHGGLEGLRLELARDLPVSASQALGLKSCSLCHHPLHFDSI